MCLPWPTGTLAIAGIPSGAISSSRISSIDRLEPTYSGIVFSLRLTSVPNTKPLTPSNLPARIRWCRPASTM